MTQDKIKENSGLPRISGLFYNCGLNCALPTILEQIQLYASVEEAGEIETLQDDELYQNYKTIKSTFAHWLCVSEDTITWGMFDGFLRSHSFAAIEILLAPTLRQTLSAFASDELNQPSPHIQRNGKYALLEDDQLQAFFYTKLHIHVTWHASRGEGQPYLQNPSFEHFPDAWLKLPIYYKPHHYELAPHEQLQEATARYTRELMAMPRPLKEVHEIQSSRQSESAAHEALAKLYMYTRNCFVVMSNEDNKQNESGLFAMSIDTFIRQHFAFDNYPGVEKRKLAFMLLYMLDEDTVDKERLNWIRQKLNTINKPSKLTKLATAVFKNWDNLDHHDIIKAGNDISPYSVETEFFLNCILGLSAGGVVLIVTSAFLMAPYAAVVALTGSACLLTSAGMFAARCLTETLNDDPIATTDRMQMAPA